MRGRPGGHTSPHKRLHIIGEPAGWICYHCGEPTRCVTCEPRSQLRRATRDHLIPWSEGGRGGANLVLSCFGCNQARRPDAVASSKIILAGGEPGTNE